LVLFCFWFPFFPFSLQICTMCECPMVSFWVLGELFFFVHFVVNCLFNNLLGFKRKRKKERKKKRKKKRKEKKGLPQKS
jgi:hypothetical protein